MKRSQIHVRTITMSAMFIAMGVILSFVKIPLSNVTEITLTGLPIAAGAYMFGPGIGFVIGALVDLCGFFAAPKGMYFPGFTLSTGLIGMIYGLILYRKWWQKKEGSADLLQTGSKGLLIRVILAHFLKTLLISLCLNILWLSMYFGMDFKTVFLLSLPKELINFPIEVFLIYSVVSLLMKLQPSLEGAQNHEK